MPLPRLLFFILACFLMAATEPVIAADPSRYAMTSVQLSEHVASRVGRQVWLNESGGNRNAITSWNASEDFASLGIGHFIWFPKGLASKFQESFPDMIAFLRERGARPPKWLDASPVPPCPWRTKREFKRAFNSPKMIELRSYLHGTVGLQTQFLVLRMEKALSKILNALPDHQDRDHVEQQFSRVLGASPDLYPLIDYISFKGEGVNPSETYPSRQTGKPQGWGLAQVLLAMDGNSTSASEVLSEFADAAGFALKQRVANNPHDKRWLNGWLKRTETYRKPLD
jgi:hypothetical protein